MIDRSFRAKASVVAASILLSAGAALGQNDRPSDDLAGMVEDWIHYVMISHEEGARALGEVIVSRFGQGVSSTDWVKVLEGTSQVERFRDAVARAQKRGVALERLAARMDRFYDEGKLAIARNPEEIARSIAMLRDGQARAKRLATERLVAAGEYAMPQLLRALIDRNDPVLREAVRNVMLDMGSHAVVPLMTALPQLDEVSQEIVADILGLLKYRTSLPALVDLRDTTASEAVQAACQRAIRRIEPAGVEGPASIQFVILADHYFQERTELTSFPGEEFQLVWGYTPQIGLFPTPVRTEVYHESMSMLMSEESLARQQSNNGTAVATWVMANLKREIETPEGYANPTYPAGRRDAMYFAVAAGSDVNQRVLVRALRDRNTQLARRSLESLERTLSGNNLQPAALVEALQYPNRRVQVEAALALGRSQPQRSFDGADRVVPTLASTIRSADSTYAVVIGTDSEVRRELRRTIEALGYQVLPDAERLSDIALEIAETPGVDLIVSALSDEATVSLINEAHASPSLAATPVLALLTDRVLELTRRYATDDLVSVRSLAIQQSEVRASAESLVQRASGGPITADEARAYQARALEVLRDLAVGGNPVLNVEDAALPLMSALDTVPGFRLEIAEVLSWIGQARVQVALMDAALNATGPQRLALLNTVAESARRYGNMLEPRQVSRVVAMARDGEGEEATTAAALMGALDLSNADLVPLILEKR